MSGDVTIHQEHEAVELVSPSKEPNPRGGSRQGWKKARVSLPDGTERSAYKNSWGKWVYFKPNITGRWCRLRYDHPDVTVGGKRYGDRIYTLSTERDV